MEIQRKFHERIGSLAAEIHSRFSHLSRDEARREVYLWISELTGLDPLRLRVDPPELTENQWDSVQDFARQRSQGLPFAYILGRAGFYGLEFAIGPGVLIPRPETEELVDRALYRAESRIRTGQSSLRILDLCAGSGCIGIALGHVLQQRMKSGKLPATNLEICFSDLSNRALEYARLNAKNLLEESFKPEFFQGDLMAPLRNQEMAPFDLICCNPPYVHPDEVDLLSPETHLHEPEEALFHSNPPELYRQILAEIAPFLAKQGQAILELSPFISEAVRMLCGSAFPDHSCDLESDLSGKCRFLIFTCKPSA
ncbi:MAG: peptide chain release factor N(5)-glutamine methyltransferase [Leptospiraceae bacterium]|nr:peptide chain release factor N(5)-glutamine methyltransferase [Leptospiraceae bacterium]